MRYLLIGLLILPGLVACGGADYQPETFRSDIERLIESGDYGSATKLVNEADPQTQAHHDGGGYLAVAEDLIYLPGIDSSIFYEPDRDWEIPGTSDAILDRDWQDAATEFASKYNRIRHEMNTEEGD